MIPELDVPRGTVLVLLAHEIDPNPTGCDELVRSVAVYRGSSDGMVQLQGHTCRGDQECAKGWCFEARVSVAGIRANLDGAR